MTSNVPSVDDHPLISDYLQAEIQILLDKRIQQVGSTFVALFAAPPASPQGVFSVTVDQALFMANDGLRNS